MTVTSVHQDLDALVLIVTSELAAPVARVWEMWSDPRLLERWWGPPVYPATFVDHDLTPGATCTYFMTGPAGDRHHGWWRIVAVDSPRALEFEDGFADGDGNPNPAMPTMHGRVALEALGEGHTRMTIRTQFPSTEAMQQVLEMGMVEGITLALGQIDALLV